MVGSLTMRHSATAAICVLALAITTMPLNAQTSLTLDQEAPLRAKPNSKSPIIARAPAGAPAAKSAARMIWRVGQKVIILSRTRGSRVARRLESDRVKSTWPDGKERE